MKKCVRVVIVPIDYQNELVGDVKKQVNFEGLEGVVSFMMPDTLEITLYGPKDRVDEGVSLLEELVIRHNIAQGDRVHFSVEPFVKSEDFRGVVRFVKKSAL